MPPSFGGGGGLPESLGGALPLVASTPESSAPIGVVVVIPELLGVPEFAALPEFAVSPELAFRSPEELVGVALSPLDVGAPLDAVPSSLDLALDPHAVTTTIESMQAFRCIRMREPSVPRRQLLVPPFEHSNHANVAHAKVMRNSASRSLGIMWCRSAIPGSHRPLLRT